MSLLHFLGALELGMIFSLVALGVYLSFRILDFPDLTADGSFPLGAAMTAVLIVKGVTPWIATIIAFLGGSCAGYITAYLNVRFNLLSLLASILVMTALYSINLRLMGGPNVALLHEETLFSPVERLLGDPGMAILAVATFLVVCVIGLMGLGLQSDLGLGLRATGENPIMTQAQGINIKNMKLGGIALSNGLIAVAGSLFTQSQGFADVTMGVGTIIIGLASVMIGESFFSRGRVLTCLLGCVVGSILYRLAIMFSLNIGFLGLQPSDLNVVTAVIVGGAMILPKLKKKTVKYFQKRAPQ